jgi:hypothetical protein
MIKTKLERIRRTVFTAAMLAIGTVIVTASCYYASTVTCYTQGQFISAVGPAPNWPLFCNQVERYANSAIYGTVCAVADDSGPFIFVRKTVCDGSMQSHWTTMTVKYFTYNDLAGCQNTWTDYDELWTAECDNASLSGNDC